MFCDRPYDLVAVAKGELPAREGAAAEAHVAACAECREEVRQLAAVAERVRALPPVEPSPGFVGRVASAARARHPEAFGRAPATAGRLGLLRALIPAPPWAISIALHAAALLVLTWVFLDSPAKPSGPESIAIRAVPPPGRATPLEGWTPPRAGAEPVRASVQPAIEEPREFTAIRDDVERPTPPAPAPPSAVSGVAPGIPTVARLDDRRILAFIDGRADARRRREALARAGGDGTEAAVQAALLWLAGRQEADGSWDPARFGGLSEQRTGVTGLAALAFLGAGNSHQAGPHRETVARALRWLASVQQATGAIGPAQENHLYGHGLGTLALLEAYCLTDDPGLKPAVAAAVGFTQFAQNAAGGWGYAPRDGNSDTSVTGWQVMGLELARAKGLLTAAASLRQAMEWIDSVTTPDGRVGYRAAGRHPNGAAALTAVGMFCHQLTAPVRDAPRLEKQAALVAAAAPPADLARPGAEGVNDFYGWYFTSVALFQHGGPAWDRWNAALKPVLLRAQDRTGPDAGSWGPLDRWSGYGGRVYTTAMGALILETYYRYPRLAK